MGLDLGKGERIAKEGALERGLKGWGAWSWLERRL